MRTHVTTRTAWLAVLLALFLCCLAVMAALSANKQADAYTTDPSATVNEIYDESTGAFNQVNLQQLINKLAGGSGNTSVNQLYNQVSRSSFVFGDDTINNSKRIAEQNIIVEFGGIKWIAVFLSLSDTTLTNDSSSSTNYNPLPNDGRQTPQTGDIILTLWQAYGEDTAKVQWNSYWDNTTAWADQKYPSNMYGTSKIRAVTLGNGGYYATAANASSLTDATSDAAGSMYAKFNQTGYIKNYLVAPRYIGWQKNQTGKNVVATYANGQADGRWLTGALNNEAWGQIGLDNYHNSSSDYYYEDKDYYRQWMDDLVWLPSATETGFTGTVNSSNQTSNGDVYTGIWNTTAEQRSNLNTAVWLRTGDRSDYHGASYLTPDGSRDNPVISYQGLIRPAIHLNLTAAVGEVEKPTDTKQNKSYNGQQQSFDLGITSSWANGTNNRVNIQITQNSSNATVDYSGETAKLTATKAGTYKVTVKPATGYRWANATSTNDTEAIEFTLTITKAPLTITANDTEISYGDNATNNGVKYEGFVNGESDSVIKGTPSFTYGEYSVGKGVGEYIITPSGLAADNYEIEFKTGTLSVKAKKITLTIADATHVYGATVAALDIGNPNGGWVKPEDKQTLFEMIEFALKNQTAPSARVELNSSLPVGKYDITAENKIYGNYDVTFNSGTYEVTKAKLTVTANDAEISYGDSPQNGGVKYDGFVNNESENVLGGSLKYDYGDYKAKESGIGKYVITPSGYTSDNYEIEFKTGTLTVKEKKITVTISNATHVYGGTAATLGIDDPDGGWVQSGDKDALLSAISSLFLLKKQTSQGDQVALNARLPVGKYDISVENGTYGNYDVTFINGVYTVTKAKLTVTANDVEISYGDNGKDNGVKIDGFVNDENEGVLGGSLSFTYGTYEPKRSGVGEYEVTPAGYTSANYEIEFKSGKLDVKAKAITVTISNAGHVYGAAVGNKFGIGDPNGGWVQSGDKDALLSAISSLFLLKKQGTGEQVTLSSTLPVGKYDITVANDTYGNYNVTFNSGTYEVTEAEIGVSGNFTWQETYGFTDGSATTYRLEIALSALTLQGEQQATIVYSAFTCSRANAKEGVDYFFQGGVYTVFKAGTYTVTATISAPNHKTVTRTISITILKAKAEVEATCDKPEKVYTDGDLPTLSYTASVGKQAVTGTIRWTKTLGSVEKSGWTLFGWRWVCDDDSVEDATGEQGFTVEVVEVRKINVVFNAGDRVFYETNALSELTQYLTVTAIFTNEKEKQLASNEYVLTCQGGSVLIAGKGVAITVTYVNGGKTVTESFTLDVEVVEVSKITVSFDAGDRTFNEKDALSELSKYLTVVAYFTDGTQKTLANNEYVLTCQGGSVLVVGEGVVITVTYVNRGKTVTESFTVDVLEAPTPTPDPDPDPTPDPDPDPKPNPNPDPAPQPTPDPEPSLLDKIREFFESTPLPLGIACAVLGTELLLIIILAIAARKPKQKK